jgi:GNAT superfamily N-acetyltransferase
VNDPAPDWTVRIAEEADLPQAIEQLTDYMDATQQAKYRRKLTRYTRDADKDLLLALDASGAIGFLCVAEYDEIPEQLDPDLGASLGDYATVTSFIVRPEQRRRGIGMSLFAGVLEWGKSRRPKGMWLITHRTGPWYHRHFGLEEVARIEVDGVTKTVMVLTHL